MTLQDKMYMVYKSQGLTPREFAEFIGIDYTILMRIVLKGKVNKSLIEALIEKLPDLDLNWLLKEHYISPLVEAYVNDRKDIQELVKSEIEFRNKCLKKLQALQEEIESLCIDMTP